MYKVFDGIIMLIIRLIINKKQMLETKYLNRRYRQTPQPPTANYFNQGLEQIPIPASSSQSKKSKINKPIQYGHIVENNVKNLNNSRHRMEESQLEKLEKVEIVDFIDKFSKIDQTQQNNKSVYRQWLHKNSLRISLPKKLFRDKVDISLNSKKSVQEQDLKAYSSSYKNNYKINRETKHEALIKIPIKKFSHNNYNVLIGTIKNQEKVRKKQNINDQQTKKNIITNNNYQKNYLLQNTQQYFSRFNNIKIKKQSEQLSCLSKKLTIQLKKQPGCFSAFQRANLKQQMSKSHLIQQKNTSYPSIIQHKQSLQHQIYFAESFKGRRPYNQDRYICQLKNNNNLNHKLMRITNKFLRNNMEGYQQQEEKNPDSNNNWFFGVFDGHGGSKCAQFVKQNIYQMLLTNRNLFTDPSQALKQTFLKLQQKYLNFCQKCVSLQSSGSCAVISFIRNKKLYVGNIGDSRALLLNLRQLKQITRDHKPDQKEQKNRIIRYGGKLYKDGSVMGVQGKQNIRIFNQTRIIPGNLNVSRTFGDIQVKLKKYGGLPGIVIAQPDVFTYPLQGEYQYLVLASDGLFQGLQNKQIHQIYVKLYQKYSIDKYHTQSFVKILTKQLIRKAAQKSNDNITIICLKLPYFQSQNN